MRVLHLAEGGFDLPCLRDQPVLARVPDVNDKIVFEGDGIALGQLPDLVLLDIHCREQRMLALGAIVTAHAFQGLFGPVDFLADVKGVEIDGDRIVEERQRGQGPEKAAPSPLRTALEDDEIVKDPSAKNPKFRPAWTPWCQQFWWMVSSGLNWRIGS